MKMRLPSLLRSFSSLTWSFFLLSITLVFALQTNLSWAQTPVFVNEIHYDNTGGDTGEAIEVAGPAGTNLAGWSIALYNGSATQLNVYATISLSGVIPDVCSGFGVLSFSHAGIQNGAPDGFALINSGSAVVQFLSYEGSFTAASGPAATMTSTDIGVSETSSTPVGSSLQLGGTGSDYEDFTWNSPAASTFGSCNTGQTFTGGGDIAPFVSSTTPANSTTNVAVDADIDINFSEDVTVAGSWFSISGGSSGAHSAVVSGGPQNFTLNPDTDFDPGETVTVTVIAAQVADQDGTADNMAADFAFSFGVTSGATGWVINEIHADPDGSLAGDANGDGTRNGTQDEFVEIVNVSGGTVDISGWTISDAVTVRHTFPAGTFVLDSCAVLVFGGGTPTGSFGGAVVQTASGGSLVLNNTGDTVTLNDGGSDLAVVTYGGEGGDNQSLTRDPDIFGSEPLVKHSTATGSGGALFSPGSQVDGSQFPGCPTVVINEINADPDATNGDANGDGTVSTSQDEFVEIINVSGSDLDISGWTLADGFSVRHTFPSGTVIADQCAVVVFAGGTPTGSFGFTTVQTASGGSLGLNNTGDTVTLNDGTSDVASVAYGSEGGDNQSLTRDPDIFGPVPLVKHSTATGSAGALFSPGGKTDGSNFAGCTAPPSVAEIYEIQGSGLASPFAGATVTTTDNVVTAVGPDGFFIQTPPARTDSDAQTSDGIFVFTGGAPTVAVGDNVDVTGDVVEFFDFTEFTNSPSVSVNSSGNALPAAVAFDGVTPDPTQPQSANELERFEGMLIQIAAGAVGESNQSFGTDPLAEVFVVANATRPFREPGAEFPGLAGLPVWDSNPEVFELDPDRLGLPNLAINAGSTFEATGVIGFEFGDYELWPTTLTVNHASLPAAVRAPANGEQMVGTLNMFRLFDQLPTPPEFQDRLTKFSGFIRNVMRAPQIVAVQEVENLSALQALAGKIAADDATVVYSAYLVEGNDIGGIDVGFLVRDNVQVDSVVQKGKDEVFTFDSSLLHDRPPLCLFAKLPDGRKLTVMNLHLRSLSGITGSSATRIRLKRQTQATSVSKMVQALQDATPGLDLVVTGDFNAFQFTDGFAHVLAQIIGDPADASEAELPGTDEVNPDLTNEILSLPAAQQYSFVFQGSAQVLDHMLTSQPLHPEVNGVQYARGNADAPRDLVDDASTPNRSSDHDGLVLYIKGKPELPHDFLFLATKALKRGRNFTEGDIHSNGALEFNKGNVGETDHTGNVTAVGKIKIRSHTRIDGDVLSATDIRLGSSVEITGAKDENAAVVPVPLTLAPFTANNDDRKVNKNKTLFLPPGTYGAIRLSTGATLELAHTGATGEYFFERLEFNKNCTFKVDVRTGPVTINVVKLFKFRNNGEMVLVTNGAVDSDKVSLNYLSSSKMQFGSDVKFFGTIIAPNAQVSFSKDTRFKGAICARQIRTRSGGVFLHHSSGSPLPPLGPDSSLGQLTLAASHDQALPTEFALEANYPNPFNPSTTISFALPQASEVTLAIYNVRGQLVRTLVSGALQAGRHQAIWDGRDAGGSQVASGLYIYRMRAGEFVTVRKMLFAK